ncbi:hypothetical protein [Brachybacterium sp. GPGPB12]|uniref:hypothetical protein n=1 Tax=Brachybacterium sp. GPGPB12 TaxID=3023517 RepID=UPI00313462B0
MSTLTSAMVTSKPAIARTWAMPPPMYPAPTMVTVEMVIRGNSFVRGRLSDEGAGAATPDAAFVETFRGLVTAMVAILLDID